MMNARVDDIVKEASENFEEIQTEINEIVLKHADDTLSLIGVASVLFSSSLKCYEVALGSDGLIKFMEQALAATREKHTNNYH